MEAGQPLSVVLADDHGIIREGIAAFLQSRRPIRVAAQCSDGDEALREILDHRPDIAILDSGLSGKSTLEVVRGAMASGCGTRFIVFASSHEEAEREELLRSGASACLRKDEPAEELERAIQCVLAGGKYVSHGLCRGAETGRTDSRPDLALLLSRREHEVFNLLTEGIRPRDVGRKLEISAKTVDTYRANILRKLELDGLAALIRFAIQQGHNPQSEIDGR